ncbi:acyltransferase [Streptomyces sp. NPDC004539]|uniref:acyltransferase family protein n=1 Tax=Streptomyces sp. NPDC004539 TaxID=3154280 RepID=UPI0033B56198
MISGTDLPDISTRQVQVGTRTFTFTPRWSHGTVAELLRGRNNSLGLLRLVLATAVVASHARVLGYGGKEFGHTFTGGQTDLGKMSVYGFFVLSGILVARSGARLPVGRFLWHRALRILPGFWVCLAVTVLVVAPLLYWKVHSTFAGLNGPGGLVAHVKANWLIATRQYDIAGLMQHQRVAGVTHNAAFNGSLWTLRHEALCYVVVAVLAVTGVLTRARRAVLLLTAFLGWLVIRQAVDERFWAGAYDARYFHAVDLPGIGFVTPVWMIYLGFAFSLGMLIELYKERIPVSDVLGVVALVVMLGSLHYGYFFVVGVPAFAYALLWLAIRLPAPFRRIGARNDYSYGIYIYGFLVQQTLAVLDVPRFGLPVYFALTMALTVALAAASWHFVEQPALRLKDIGRPTPVAPTPVAPAPAKENVGVG